jgi:hypothetical protein
MFTDTFVLGHDTEIMALAKGSAPFDTKAGTSGGTSTVNMSDADLDQITDPYSKTPVEMLYSYNLEGTSASGGEVDLTPTGSLFDGEVGKDLTDIIGQPQQSAPATGYSFDQLAALSGDTGEDNDAYAEALYENGGSLAMEAYGMGDMIDRGGDDEQEKKDDESPTSPTIGPPRTLPSPSSPSPARGSGLTLGDLTSGPSTPKPRSRVQSQIDALEESIKSQIDETEDRMSQTRKNASRDKRAARRGKKDYGGLG